jgi:phage gpG-like protein
MGITVTRNFGDLRELLPDGESLMREIADFAVAQIRTRTEQGIDFEGRPFRPLSEGYAKQKTKALGHSRADLTVSGRMLNDMGPVAVTERSCEISFRSQGGRASGNTFIQRSRSVGAADKAFFHVEGNHGVIRDFFGLSDEDEERILQFVEDEADRRIDRL